MKVKISSKYIDQDAIVTRATYPNGSTALVLNAPSWRREGGQRLAVATVALEELPGEGNVFIKDWSENEGILKALQDANVIGPVIRSVRTGFVTVQEVKLLVGEEVS